MIAALHNLLHMRCYSSGTVLDELNISSAQRAAAGVLAPLDNTSPAEFVLTVAQGGQTGDCLETDRALLHLIPGKKGGIAFVSLRVLIN